MMAQQNNLLSLALLGGAHYLLFRARSLLSSSQSPVDTRLRIEDVSKKTTTTTTKLSDDVPMMGLVFNDIDMFIFDCDGVIWKGDSLIEHAAESLAYLRSLGKKVLFMTNNSSKSRLGFLKKFQCLGVQAVEEEVFSSSFAIVAYLQRHPPDFGRKELVYVVGMEGICDELSRANIAYLGGPADAAKSAYEEEVGGGSRPILKPIAYDPQVTSVVVGLDTNINYYKIQYAQLCINNIPGCKLFATNLDKVAHLTKDMEWADGGSSVGAIAGCVEKEPIVVGKPSSVIIDHIVDKFKVQNKSRICMVGDRLDTDILFGLNSGLATILTLSGVTTEVQLLSETNKIIPRYYIDSIADFLKLRK